MISKLQFTNLSFGDWYSREKFTSFNFYSKITVSWKTFGLIPRLNKRESFQVNGITSAESSTCPVQNVNRFAGKLKENCKRKFSVCILLLRKKVLKVMWIFRDASFCLETFVCLWKSDLLNTSEAVFNLNIPKKNVTFYFWN